MDDEAALIRAVQASPEDTDLLLVYADWLEEHDDPRAEYLRLRVALTNGTAGWPLAPLWQRYRELRETIPMEWLTSIHQITFLDIEQLDSMRRRPGMYIGDTGRSGLHHLLFGLIEDAAFQLNARNCYNVEVRLMADGGCLVAHDGLSAFEIKQGLLSSNFRYHRDCGIHCPLNALVACAMASECRVETVLGGESWQQVYRGGFPAGPPQKSSLPGKGTSAVFS